MKLFAVQLRRMKRSFKRYQPVAGEAAAHEQLSSCTAAISAGFSCFFLLDHYV